MAELCEFELERERLIEANKRKIMELDLLQHASSLKTVQLKLDDAGPSSKPKAPRKVQPSVPDDELRRSNRDVKRPSYREQDYYDAPMPLRKAGSYRRPARDSLQADDVERIRREFAARTGQVHTSSVVDSGRGVRVQGGRVYDSALGVTCHWCRQKTLCEQVTCTSQNCGGGRRLPVSFCKMCLLNRHGEDVEEAKASGSWVCPCCRDSCGAGCTSCCNCGPCRKKHGLAPTRQMVREARDSGFGNVHDYLVHLETGEAAEEIADRKNQFPWGAWLHSCHESEEEAGPELLPSSSSVAAAADGEATAVADAAAAPVSSKKMAPARKASGAPSTVSEAFAAKKRSRRNASAEKKPEAAPPVIMTRSRRNTCCIRA